MKKILLIGAFLAAMVAAAEAQVSVKASLAAGDTILNTGTVAKVIRVTGSLSGLAVQANTFKIGGTFSGTVAIQGSLDGVLYTTLATGGTLTNTASQSTNWYITGPVPEYIKVTWTGGGGSMSATTSLWTRQWLK